MALVEDKKETMANFLQRIFGRGEPVPTTAPAAVSTVSADAAKASPGMMAASQSYGAFPQMNYSQMWLSGNDAIRRQNFIYSDTPTGRIMAVKYNTWASNCVAARSETIASVPLKLYKRTPEMAAKARARTARTHTTGWIRAQAQQYAAVKAAFDKLEDAEEQTDHPVLALLTDVNPINLDKISYREQLERQLSLHGTAYTHKVRGSDDKPAELYVLLAQYTVPVPDAQVFCKGYEYMGQYPYDARDVLRIYYPDDDNPILGRAPTSTALNSINSYNMADIAQQGIDRRGGQGGGIISTNFEQMQVDAERFMAEWDSMRANPANAGRDAFLGPGFDYKAGVLTAQQQQREQRSMRLIKEIMSGYRVPPSIGGDYTDASILANAAQQSTNFWVTWVLPELKRIEECMTYFLLWQDWPEAKDESLYLAHDVSEVPALQADALQEAQVQQAYVSTATQAVDGGIWSVNEARQYTGEEEIENDAADNVLLVIAKRNVETTAINEETGKEAEPESVSGEGQEMAGQPLVETTTPQVPMQLAQMTPMPQPMMQTPTQAAPAQSAKAITTIPVFDFVGMSAITPDGEGVIESIKRFGQFETFTATKAEPVIIVNGKPYAHKDVKVVIA